MKVCVTTIKGISPIAFGRPFQTPKPKDLTHDEYEEQYWRERCHSDKDGHVIIPPIMFKKSLVAAAQYLQMKVPGKKGSTFTKRFQGGIMITEPIVLDTKVQDVVRERLFVPSDGKPNSKGGRVWRNFPVIQEWRGDLVVHVLDSDITESVFHDHMEGCAKFIGIATFRPANGGYYGRFAVEEYKWQDMRPSKAA